MENENTIFDVMSDVEKRLKKTNLIEHRIPN